MNDPQNPSLEMSTVSSSLKLPCEFNLGRRCSTRMSVPQGEYTMAPHASLASNLGGDELKKNPPSVLTENDVTRIQRDYNISSVVFRVPLATERPTDVCHDEIVVYDSLFASGLRDSVPDLIATMATYFSVTPGQFSPTAWRVLMAIQNFGEFYKINISVNEVLYGYYFLTLTEDIGRYSLHPRRHCPMVIDLQSDDKELTEKGWRKKYLFMKVGHNPGFPTTWRLTDVRAQSRIKGTVGRLATTRISNRPLQHRSVKFLTSRFGLEGSTIWGFDMSNSHLRSVPDAFTGFLAASGKLSNANQSISLCTVPDYGDELQCIEDPSVSKHKVLKDTATSSAAKRSKFTHCDMTVRTTTSQIEMLGSTEAASVAEELKSKILSHDLASLVVGASTISDGVYTDLLKAMSAFHLLEKKLSSTLVEIASGREVIDDLNHQVDSDKKRVSDVQIELASKDEKITCLEKKVQERDSSILGLEITSKGLVKDKGLLEQEIAVLKTRNDALKYELDMFSNGATIIARWVAIRECLLGEHKKWKLGDVDAQYQHVMRVQAKYKGMLPPVFEESLAALGAREQAASEHDTSEPPISTLQ